MEKLGKEKKFKKDFTPEQYLAYLNRKAMDPEALITEDKELLKPKSVSNKEAL